MVQEISQDNFVINNPSLWKRCNIVMTMIVVIMVVEICCISRSDLLWGGDSYSDTDVLLAGGNFEKYGFWELHFLPVFQRGELSSTPSYYLHYPPLPDIINGILQKAGIQSLYVMRLFSGMFVVVGFILLYRVIGTMLNPLIAVCGIGLLPLTLFFLKYCNSLHCHSYHIFFIGLFLFSFHISLEKKNLFSGCLCWFLLFLISLISFEFILFCTAFALLFLLFSKQLKNHIFFSIILISAPFTGVFLHFLQNIWAIGLLDTLSDNMGFSRRNGDNFIAQFDAMRVIPFHLTSISLEFFHMSWLGICALFFLAFVHAFSPKSFCSERAVAFLASIVISSFMWYIFMPSHTIAHQHIISQLLILFIIGMGFLLAQLIYRITDRRVALPVRFLFLFFLFILLLNNFYQIKMAFKEHPPFSRCLPRVIGPNACPENAAIVKDKKLSGQYSAFFLKCPVWPYPQDMNLNREILDKFQKSLSKKYHFYYLYYGQQDYTNDPIFIDLASQYYGKSYTYELPGIGKEAIILFDIHTLLTKKTTIDKNIIQQQMKGVFSPWIIEGFETRLKAEFP